MHIFGGDQLRLISISVTIEFYHFFKVSTLICTVLNAVLESVTGAGDHQFSRPMDSIKVNLAPFNLEMHSSFKLK